MYRRIVAGDPPKSCQIPTGPFPGRPDIRFDALVVVNLVPGQAPAASVIDLTSGKPTPLPPGSLLIAGRAVAVNVPGSLLPSTGLDPSQYRFNYWPEDGLPGSTNIASFAPEFNDALVGALGQSQNSQGTAAIAAASALPSDLLLGVIDTGQVESSRTPGRQAQTS
jgi:hypothetical protein